MKYLNDQQVKDILAGKWHVLIDDIERALVDKSGDMVPKIYLDGINGDFRAMPASLGDYSAVKWISVFPNNKKFDLPTTLGTVILSERHTGKPLIAMDCTTLTAYRTAAVSAIAAKHCAPDASNFTFIGCGLQARYHIEAYEAVYGHMNMLIDVYDKDDSAMKELHTWIGEENIARSWGWNKSVKQACKHTDIITTLTPSTEAYLGLEDIGDNVMHINAIGADAVGKRELKDDIWQNFDLVVDDWEQASHSGESQYLNSRYATHGGPYDFPHTALQAVLQGGEVKGRPTVFDSTGIAIEDIATAILVFKLALDQIDLGPE